MLEQVHWDSPATVCMTVCIFQKRECSRLWLCERLRDCLQDLLFELNINLKFTGGPQYVPNSSLRPSTWPKGRCLWMGDAVCGAEWDFTDVGMVASKQLAWGCGSIIFPTSLSENNTTRHRSRRHHRQTHRMRSSKEELSQSQDVIPNNHKNHNRKCFSIIFFSSQNREKKKQRQMQIPYPQHLGFFPLWQNVRNEEEIKRWIKKKIKRKKEILGCVWGHEAREEAHSDCTHKHI